MNDYIDIIQRKRDGGHNTREDIKALIDGFMSGDLREYQMSAWLMAVFLKGLSLEETLALTDAIIASGRKLDLSRLGRRVVDKHSTGGVGDKVSIILGPLVAACGAVFGKMSGRGLGHTGGTVDKLEAIPGFQTALTPERFIGQLEQTGICIAGQSTQLAPADDRLYGLREVTATVESNPLTAASIMSKKIAAGAGVVVLDVKVGCGAFFRNKGQAAGVSYLMRQIGEANGMCVDTVMTAMDQPLGHAVGNALEVNEAVRTLAGEGPEDLVEVVMALAGRLLSRAVPDMDQQRAVSKAGAVLASGKALEKFREWIEAQGGDSSFMDEPELLPVAGYRSPVTAGETGFVQNVDALAVGRAVLGLGAGRRRKGEAVDHSVGAIINAKVGDRVEAGREIATVYGKTAGQAEQAAQAITRAYRFSGKQVAVPSPVLS
ncbi:pyrimidine-nucleoside phosphorylase [bacterium BMS3Abin01]|nr:pyrimidine-nucleoside phosphorylase [bacterium BMS3Abin01]